MRWNAYYLPATIDEALELLARHEGRARAVGGGTDLFLEQPYGGSPYGRAAGPPRQPPDALVDVTRAAGARDLREDDGWIVIGCGATHAQIAASPLIQARGAALAEACGQIGGPQVRNVATLAGNVAHALPAADGTLALLALGGEALVASPGGRIWRPLASLFRGPGASAIDSTRQVLAALRFQPTGPGQGSAFARVMRPQGVALPILGLAARVALAGGRITAASVALGPVAPTPFRAAQTEAWLAGKPADDATLDAAVAVLLGECHSRTSPHRATADYRRALIPALFRQAAQAALSRASNP
jgi:carbon-monoxide dehydrogenase medium subunit